MTGPEYFSLEASGHPMLVIGRSYKKRGSKEVKSKWLVDLAGR